MNLYAVRIKYPEQSPPIFYVGPLTHQEAYDLGERLTQAGRSWEAGQLLTEQELPGLWEAPTQ